MPDQQHPRQRRIEHPHLDRQRWHPRVGPYIRPAWRGDAVGQPAARIVILGHRPGRLDRGRGPAHLAIHRSTLPPPAVDAPRSRRAVLSGGRFCRGPVLSGGRGTMANVYRELDRAELPVDLGDAVVWVRTPTSGPGSIEPHRIVPDGCLDVIWIDGEVLVAGPDTRAYLSPRRDGASYVGIRFAGGTGPGVLGVGADELRDTRIPLADLWAPAEVRRLVEWSTARPRWPGPCGGAGPSPTRSRARSGGRCGPAPGSARPPTRYGLSARQLHRRVPPAHSGTARRRWPGCCGSTRALALARTGAPLGPVASHQRGTPTRRTCPGTCGTWPAYP